MRWPKTLMDAVGWLVRGLRFAAQLALVSMVLTICYDVVMRYVFAKPTLWALEVNTFLIVFLAVLPAGDVLRSGNHLKIGYFPDRMSPLGRRLQRIFSSLLGLGFSAMMTWKGWLMAQQAFAYDERMSTSLGTPLGIPYLFLPIGFGALALQFVVEIVLDVTGTPRPSETEEPAPSTAAPVLEPVE